MATRLPASSDGPGDRAFLGHANRQRALADAQFQPIDQRVPAFGHQVAAGDPQVNRPLGAEDGYVGRTEEGDFQRQLAAAGKQAPLLPAKVQPGFFQ